jgi:hypothetical protein
MSLPFFTLAMTSPERQHAFRRMVGFHLVLIAGIGFGVHVMPNVPLTNLGHVLVIAAIIEGAFLIGWRLVQIPKSQALEFLLVSPLQPRRVFLAEAFAGLGRLALVTLAGLPILLLMTMAGKLYLSDLPALLLIPFLWGGITGIGLATWAYERVGIRRWGERVMIVAIVIYLVVGVLAAERLSEWLTLLPWQVGEFTYRVIFLGSQYNPFGLLEYWLSPTRNADLAQRRVVILAIASLLFLLILMARSACRLKGHFHDRHYKPLTDERRRQSSGIGERPLAWWAVRRVMEYSGRMNLWLAGGFGLVYAAFILLGDNWPAWMGRMVFDIFEKMGGVPALTTGLAVLAAVPAAFQYGLWDPSPQDRCRRLELLLLTELDGTDYWGAALAAAWRRGRGYLLVAVILWLAMGIAGRATPLQIVMAMTAAVVLWGFSFAVGFRAFSRGVHANGLGSLLTLGFPILTAGLIALHVPVLAALLPTGAVYQALATTPSMAWLPGPMIIAMLTVGIAVSARRHCVHELRAWFEGNQGRKVMT